MGGRELGGCATYYDDEYCSTPLFPARTLQHLWSNEAVPSYACPYDPANYAPAAILSTSTRRICSPPAPPFRTVSGSSDSARSACPSSTRSPCSVAVARPLGATPTLLRRARPTGKSRRTPTRCSCTCTALWTPTRAGWHLRTAPSSVAGGTPADVRRRHRVNGSAGYAPSRVAPAPEPIPRVPDEIGPKQNSGGLAAGRWPLGRGRDDACKQRSASVSHRKRGCRRRRGGSVSTASRGFVVGRFATVVSGYRPRMGGLRGTPAPITPPDSPGEPPPEELPVGPEPGIVPDYPPPEEEPQPAVIPDSPHEPLPAEDPPPARARARPGACLASRRRSGSGVTIPPDSQRTPPPDASHLALDFGLSAVWRRTQSPVV